MSMTMKMFGCIGLEGILSRLIGSVFQGVLARFVVY